MQKSFDGLSGIVQNQLGKDATSDLKSEFNLRSGDVYIFLGKDLTKVKLLVWEASGFMLFYCRRGKTLGRKDLMS